MSNRNPIETLKKTRIHTYPVNFYRTRKREKYRKRLSVLIYFSRHLKTAFERGGSVDGAASGAELAMCCFPLRSQLPLTRFAQKPTADLFLCTRRTRNISLQLCPTRSLFWFGAGEKLFVCFYLL